MDEYDLVRLMHFKLDRDFRKITSNKVPVPYTDEGFVIIERLVKTAFDAVYGK